MTRKIPNHNKSEKKIVRMFVGLFCYGDTLNKNDNDTLIPQETHQRLFLTRLLRCSTFLCSSRDQDLQVIMMLEL